MKRTYTGKWIDGASKAVGYGDAPYIKNKMKKIKGHAAYLGEHPGYGHRQVQLQQPQGGQRDCGMDFLCLLK